MRYITKAQFAKIISTSPQFVEKIQSRLSFVNGQGKKPKIDLEGADTKEFIRDRIERNLPVNIPDDQLPKKAKTLKQKSKPQTKPQNVKQEPVPEAPPPEPEEEPETTETENQAAGEVRSILSDILHIDNADNSKVGYEKIKLQRQIEELEIKNQQKRGELISKTLVKKVFDRLYSIDENQFKSLGINVTPKISAIYSDANATRANEILELLERKEDKKLKSEITSILNYGEEDRINDMNQVFEDATGAILKGIQHEIRKFLKSVSPDAE